MAQWYYARDKQKLGPFSTEQMQQLASAGLIQATDMVLEDGTQRWLEARSAGLLFPGSRVETPSSSSAPAAAAAAAAETETAVPKMEVMCPACRHKMTLNETVRGREIRCPQCNNKYIAAPPSPALSEGAKAPDAGIQERKPHERARPEEARPERKPRIRNLVAYQVAQGDNGVTIAVACSCGEVTQRSFPRQQLEKVVTCTACGRAHRGFEED